MDELTIEEQIEVEKALFYAYNIEGQSETISIVDEALVDYSVAG